MLDVELGSCKGHPRPLHYGGQVNYTEEYELRWKGAAGGWKLLNTFETEPEAVEAMNEDARDVSGAWRVVRVSEVTVASVAKA